MSDLRSEASYADEDAKTTFPKKKERVEIDEKKPKFL